MAGGGGGGGKKEKSSLLPHKRTWMGDKVNLLRVDIYIDCSSGTTYTLAVLLLALRLFIIDSVSTETNIIKC